MSSQSILVVGTRNIGELLDLDIDSVDAIVAARTPRRTLGSASIETSGSRLREVDIKMVIWLSYKSLSTLDRFLKLIDRMSEGKVKMSITPCHTPYFLRANDRITASQQTVSPADDLPNQCLTCYMVTTASNHLPNQKPACCVSKIDRQGHNSCPPSVHSPSLSQWIDHKYGALSAITLNIKLESSRIKHQIQALSGKWPSRADYSIVRYSGLVIRAKPPPLRFAWGACSNETRIVSSLI